jgi:hypothetical protein
MEILESTYTTFTFFMLAVLLVALFVAQFITSAERRLIGGTAVLLAGVFFVARAPAEPLVTLVGIASWAAGLALFSHACLGWRRDRASRAGPVAAFVLLPPALVGAILLGGIAIVLLDPPVRVIMRLVGA